METFQEARKEGKIRFIGFSAHSVEAAMALMDRFDFDTILFPTNYTTWYAGNFGPKVLQRAQQNGMGILALKAMAKGPWPEEVTERISKCWRRSCTVLNLSVFPQESFPCLPASSKPAARR